MALAKVLLNTIAAPIPAIGTAILNTSTAWRRMATKSRRGKDAERSTTMAADGYGQRPPGGLVTTGTTAWRRMATRSRRQKRIAERSTTMAADGYEKLAAVKAEFRSTVAKFGGALLNRGAMAVDSQGCKPLGKCPFLDWNGGAVALAKVLLNTIARPIPAIGTAILNTSTAWRPRGYEIKKRKGSRSDPQHGRRMATSSRRQKRIAERSTTMAAVGYELKKTEEDRGAIHNTGCESSNSDLISAGHLVGVDAKQPW